MRNPGLPLILSAFALALLCCTRPDPNARSSAHAAVQRRIDRLNAIYDTCLRVRSAAFFEEWYMPDACTMPEGMPRVCGREAIADLRWNNGHSSVFRLALHCERVDGGTELMVEQGNYLLTTTLGAALDRGKFLVVWRPDEQRRWKIQQEIWNSDVPHDAPPDTLSELEG